MVPEIATSYQLNSDTVLPTLSVNVSYGLDIALRPQTTKHIRGGWSHYTDTSEPVDGGVIN
jgi:hypothetical protein